MMCRDGIEVPWPHSDAYGTTLDSKQLLRVIGTRNNALAKLLAHGELTRAQISMLYSNGTKTKSGHYPLRALGLRRRITGKRIQALGLDPHYLEGLGEKKLIRLFNNEELRTNKRAMLKALLSHT